MKLLIGSEAMKYHGLLNRKSNDIDFICDFESYKLLRKMYKKLVPFTKSKVGLFNPNEKPCEVEIAWSDSGSSIWLLDLVKRYKHLATQTDEDTYVASPDLLYTLKCSHKYLKDSPHFLKNLNDYNLLKESGCKVPSFLKSWLKLREKETYTHKRPRLKDISKKEFFNPNSGVPYKYDHDTIHLSVKHLDEPAYNYFKPDKSEVHCSKDMFFTCSEEVRLYSVVEESYVLALERSQIPTDFKVKPKLSFDIALSKVCTSITSGWWREYAYDNYNKAQDLYSDDYVNKFKAALNNGVIKDFNA